MNLKENRKKVLERLQEFKKSIPKRKSLFSRKSSVDVSKLGEIESKISSFYQEAILIAPMSIDKESITPYMDTVDLVKQFPEELQPETVMESYIFENISKGPQGRRKILLPGVMERDSQIKEDYEKMVAYYMLRGGENPVKRFSKVEMAMKNHGIQPDLGMAITKYGDQITTKLEEISVDRGKTPKEWECFKNQVLHSYSTAEAIGNRNVNTQEHENWEERLIRLGILERKRDERPEQKEETLRDSIRYDVSKRKDDKDDRDSMQQRVLTEEALRKNAEQMYVNTGMMPIGYKKDENGKIVRNLPSFDFKNKEANKLSLSREQLSTTNNQQRAYEGSER